MGFDMVGMTSAKIAPIPYGIATIPGAQAAIPIKVNAHCGMPDTR